MSCLAPSPTRATPRPWPTWSAPTATITARWPSTPKRPRGAEGDRPGPPAPDLGPSTPSEPVPLEPAGVLPRRPRRIRHGPGARRCAGRARTGPHARRWRHVVDLGHLGGPAPTRPPAQRRGRAVEIQACLRTPQMRAPTAVETAYGAQVAAAVAVIAEMTRQIAALEAELGAGFEAHPDAQIVRSLPGLGTVLGARVLGEFGDARTATPMVRHDGTTPVPRRSPGHRARNGPCWPATSATGSWPTTATSGRSAP